MDTITFDKESQSVRLSFFFYRTLPNHLYQILKTLIPPIIIIEAFLDHGGLQYYSRMTLSSLYKKENHLSTEVYGSCACRGHPKLINIDKCENKKIRYRDLRDVTL